MASLKTAVAVSALLFALAPFVSSAWNYHRASKIQGLPKEMVARRKEAAYEWRGWKVLFSGIALILNTIVDLLP